MDNRGGIRISDAPNIIVVLIIVGIFLGLGAIIMLQFQDAQADTVATATVTNESQSSVVQGTAFSLDQLATHDVGFSATDLVAMVNNSNVHIAAGNYTFTAAGTITMANTTNLFEDGVVNFSYTYTATDENDFWNITEDTTSGLDTVSSFQTVIAVVVAAAIILGVVLLIRR